MKRPFLHRLHHKASHLAFNNVLYNWSLGGSVPENFFVRLIDTWPGDAERGRWLCGLQGDQWQAASENESMAAFLHGFSWLRDLKALGGETARLHARHAAEDWMKRYHACDPAVWRPDYTGARLAHWIALYEFFGASADENFQDRFFTSLIRQARHLSRSLSSSLPGLAALQAVRGLVFAGIALAGRESWLEQALDMLQQESGKQILLDGGHVSRNPEELLAALRLFIDIRAALLAGGYPVPLPLDHNIDRMAQALRFFRYADKGFALFHGAQEGDRDLADIVLARSNGRARVMRNLPQTGFERLVLGRSVVMADCGAPPPYPYDGAAHASPLAFEFVYGRERVFTSCGGHPFDPAWQDSLRATAAHTALALDCRNACEVRDDRHFGRRPRKVTVNRQDTRDALLLEMTHDGYVPLSGITHRRRLYLRDGGHDLRGEDSLTCSVGLQKPVEAAVRFHLHPRVLVSLIRDGEEALLRLPGGAGWRFAQSGGRLLLENSVYLGEGVRPRKTKQLVIAASMAADHALVKWALQRESR